MPTICIAMNTVWFWFDKKNRRRLHGTTQDVMRKFDLISSKYPTMAGLEIFIDPSTLLNEKQFSKSFYKKYYFHRTLYE
ncbi:hypothetical protein MHK_006165 [Candidatus Magnetomorum sp. HK-1]|nr:hypothetical protein MHK_006165 [Candidatus Magnetomorum sp. HK-1]